jgi:aldehyde:ferredoxin oxidoreductase
VRTIAVTVTPTVNFRHARVLFLDLGAMDSGRRTPATQDWMPEDPVLARLAPWGGSALAVALAVESARESPSAAAPLILAVGNAVRRGVPTAARMTVASRGALTGGFSEGQVGGDSAFRLGAFADALVLRGTVTKPGAVLEIDEAGRGQLHSLPELFGLKSSETRRALSARFGGSAALYVGPAGERGVRFATLISGLDHASHVGRGGLGAVFGRLGLKALVFTGADPETKQSLKDSHSTILSSLVSSPRLRARAEGGTHELWSAFAARGELRGKNYSSRLSSEEANQLWSDSRAAATERRGCPGCPTPCGFVVDAGGGKTQSGPRFGAAWALGPNLGFANLDPALGLFEICDDAGIDAKETGAVLALLMRAHELDDAVDGPEWGTEAKVRECISELLTETKSASFGALGAAALARELGLEHELYSVGDQSVRPDQDLASLLGQCVSSNGADPMRSFPFTSGDGLDRARMQRLLGEIRLPSGAEDRTDPHAVGRLVWWHENFVAAVDASGFCSFSAGSLVSDAVIGLDQLCAWISPNGEASASALLDVGATIVWLRRELAMLWDGDTQSAWPNWVRDTLELPGVLDEYHLARGLDTAGKPTNSAREALEKHELFNFGCSRLAHFDATHSDPAVLEQVQSEELSTRLGRLIVRASGPLGDLLGGQVELELELPASLENVLAHLVEQHPVTRSKLYFDERPIAATYRTERLLAPCDQVQSGDVLDIVVAVSGG